MNTRDGDFYTNLTTTAKTPMMYKYDYTIPIVHLKKHRLTIGALPYQLDNAPDIAFEFVILLPDARAGLSSLEVRIQHFHRQ